MADVAINVAETILKKITPLVQDHLNLLWGLSGELENLGFLVSMIKAIQDDTRDGDHNRTDQVWLENLDKIMNEITRVLDYFQSRADSISPVSDDSNLDDHQKAMKKREKEDGCLFPLSYFLSRPNPIYWIRDSVMAGKIKTIRQRLLDNLSDKKLLEFHPAVKKKQAPPSDNQSEDTTIIAPSARAWTLASDYMVIIEIHYLPEKLKLPSLHSLPRLEQLALEHLTLEYIFEADTPPSPGKLFPKLRKLWIRHCPNLKGWWNLKLPTMENDDDNKLLELTFPRFPCLEHLDLREFNDLIWFPVFPEISSTLYMEKGSILHFERTRNLLPDSRGFSKIQYLWFSKVGDMEYLDIQLFPSLINLELWDCENLRGWGKGEDSRGKVPAASSLKTFDLKNCPRLECLPRGMRELGAKTTVKINGCDKLKVKYATKSGPDWPSRVDSTYLTLDW
nr:putative disease resistance protein RGA4 [Ipomoea batatas]GMD38822.1 putative disease resistance protein RGA4 [Ipomoea batatas]GME15796.1 putative disease resistance protein RGA4 [Ipomoea batatas]